MVAIANKPALTCEKPKAERDAGLSVPFAEAVNLVPMLGENGVHLLMLNQIVRNQRLWDRRGGLRKGGFMAHRRQ
jgi:hypothetical protein